nr:ribonuclease H-like domain-containing protein [Tanacetum cinerariifolium]
MKNEMKARGTMLMALPNKDQLKFHSYQDAKLLMEAIEKRYGGNKESKKVQKALPKQQYENFAASSSETLDQTFDRLQKLISQLKIQGEVIEKKADIETISLDYLYNNLKIYEPELTGSSSTSQNPQNMTFVSSNSANSTRSTNEAYNTAYGVSTIHTQGNTVNFTSIDNLSDAVVYAFLASQPNSPQLAREDLEQIDLDDLEEMDLHWEMAMLTIKARRFIKRTSRNLDINGNYIPPKPDLTFIDKQVKSDFVDVVSNVASSDVKTVESKHKSVDVKNKEFEPKVEIKTFRPSIEKIKFVKPAKEKVEKAATVNTACYVLNKALVIKSHNKTPYELIRGRPPLIYFMKPFGCPVTILNTREHLGNFDEKAGEGFFSGTLCSPVSTAGPSFVNTALPSLINVVGTPACTNAFEEHPFERFPPFKNAFSLSHVLIVTPINDTGIFGNAYDDEAMEG